MVSYSGVIVVKRGFIPIIFLIVIGILAASTAGFVVFKSMPKNALVTTQTEVASSTQELRATTTAAIESGMGSKLQSILKGNTKVQGVESTPAVPAISPVQTAVDTSVIATPIKSQTDVVSQAAYNEVLKELDLLDQGFSIIDASISSKAESNSKGVALCESKYNSDVAYTNTQYDNQITQGREISGGFGINTGAINQIEKQRKYALETLQEQESSCLAQYSSSSSLASKMDGYKAQAKQIQSSLTIDNAIEMLGRVRALQRTVLNTVS